MNDDESDLGAFLAGFVIGALVGAATALILAPQSGRATREQIASFGTDLRHVGEERLGEIRTTADTYAREYREAASSIMTDTRGRVTQLGDQVQDQVRIVLDSGRDQGEEMGPAADSNDNGVANS